MNFVNKRAVSLCRYLIEQGIDPYEALSITISKYIYNPKINVRKLIEIIKKELKEYYDEN